MKKKFICASMVLILTIQLTFVGYLAGLHAGRLKADAEYFSEGVYILGEYDTYGGEKALRILEDGMSVRKSDKGKKLSWWETWIDIKTYDGLDFNYDKFRDRMNRKMEPIRTDG